MATIYIFGNGNTSFEDFEKYYAPYLSEFLQDSSHRCIVCDFRGVDTLLMEFLKTKTANLSVYHVGDWPRYLPDAFRTFAAQWKIIGGFKSDAERDQAAIDECTHFLAVDFNSDEKRKSGTQKNIERCIQLGKIPILKLIQ
jgi:hypothetical protein